MDEICNQTGLLIERVSATLGTKELNGLGRKVSGLNYKVVREEQTGHKA
jgi:hypothetical protein